MRARLAELGGTVRAGLPADFGKLILEETEKWGKVIRLTNIKPEWGGSEPTILLDSPSAVRCWCLERPVAKSISSFRPMANETILAPVAPTHGCRSTH
jgi:hypothetical protein